jgi:ABC-type sugar transport system ATPase subunit
MVGREMDQHFPRHRPTLGEDRLRIEGFSLVSGGRRLVDGVDLSVRAGEIVSLAGLQGSGNSHLLMGLFGVYGRQTACRAWLDGQPFLVRSPRNAIRRGMALLTNDRKATGLVLSLSVFANTTLADLARFSSSGWLQIARERRAAATMTESLRFRAA